MNLCLILLSFVFMTVDFVKMSIAKNNILLELSAIYNYKIAYIDLHVSMRDTEIFTYLQNRKNIIMNCNLIDSLTSHITIAKIIFQFKNTSESQMNAIEQSTKAYKLSCAAYIPLEILEILKEKIFYFNFNHKLFKYAVTKMHRYNTITNKIEPVEDQSMYNIIRLKPYIKQLILICAINDKMYKRYKLLASISQKKQTLQTFISTLILESIPMIRKFDEKEYFYAMNGYVDDVFFSMISNFNNTSNNFELLKTNLIFEQAIGNLSLYSTGVFDRSMKELMEIYEQMQGGMDDNISCPFIEDKDSSLETIQEDNEDLYHQESDIKEIPFNSTLLFGDVNYRSQNNDKMSSIGSKTSFLKVKSKFYNEGLSDISHHQFNYLSRKHLKKHSASKNGRPSKSNKVEDPNFEHFNPSNFISRIKDKADFFLFFNKNIDEFENAFIGILICLKKVKMAEIMRYKTLHIRMDFVSFEEDESSIEYPSDKKNQVVVLFKNTSMNTNYFNNIFKTHFSVYKPPLTTFLLDSMHVSTNFVLAGCQDEFFFSVFNIANMNLEGLFYCVFWLSGNTALIGKVDTNNSLIYGDYLEMKEMVI